MDYTERPCAPPRAAPQPYGQEAPPHILRSWGAFCKVDPSQSPWPAPHAHAAQPAAYCKPRKTLLPCHHSDRRETGALGLDSKPPAWRQDHPPQQPPVRKYANCPGVEDEFHVMFECSHYADIKATHFDTGGQLFCDVSIAGRGGSARRTTHWSL